MSRRLLSLAAVSVALTVVTPAVAAEAQSVTATGSDAVKVTPTNRHSNASILAAVEAAENAGITGAVPAAHTRALKYAAAVGLTLGAVESISDVQNSQVLIGPIGVYSSPGPFGPNQYCGTERRATVKIVNKRPKVVRVRKVHVCDVPSSETTTLTITYAAT
jgi:hypothetical protein